jgi:hypothetical protein
MKHEFHVSPVVPNTKCTAPSTETSLARVSVSVRKSVNAALRTELPEIARSRNRRSRQQSGVKVVEGIRTVVLKIGEYGIDLRWLKAGPCST